MVNLCVNWARYLLNAILGVAMSILDEINI